ncbi:ABC-F family ATP-binding cassette domain-containing protein [Sphingobacterium griseoflavum]|uniref:ABC transporter ATP-binding protein n=1 Tax=Sphingobacterium griseoflavum TaxID=1474952 RepID=A0ABQ3HZC7_9SPHI|nr:ABC-F family ATP-binding cassette domain-containing protein [Sphingobacterium griseoflavum]GHE42432.1 ABC transporter ATP-binding protein [Sphingobacterium griseoflavum]
MLTIHDVTYLHPDRELLFQNLSFSISKLQKAALIGHNGSGKSTLLKLIAGELRPFSGMISVDAPFYYVPQLVGQYHATSIADALGLGDKLRAYYRILEGDVDSENFTALDDDWELEERCQLALAEWGFPRQDLLQPITTLSGGQKMKIFLAGISVREPKLLLMDEPTNHLDAESREILYAFIRRSSMSMLVVSHDRELLRLLDSTYELSSTGVTLYSGNYDFYKQQKDLSLHALQQYIHGQETAIRKAKEKERIAIERQQRTDARGKKKQEKAGVARIMINTLRNKAENSGAKLRSQHAEKMDGMRAELTDLRASRPAANTMQFGLAASGQHHGKLLVKATRLNLNFGTENLWQTDLDFQLRSGERIHLQGANGSGKTALTHIILGKTEPSSGICIRQPHQAFYIDQDYSFLKPELTIYEQVQHANDGGLLEHEVKTKLNQFLFTAPMWDRYGEQLSGGERMRLALCCLALKKEKPDVLILDEPTNNLDIQNIEILTAAINEYKGTLIIISHDQTFTDALSLQRSIKL